MDISSAVLPMRSGPHHEVHPSRALLRKYPVNFFSKMIIAMALMTKLKNIQYITATVQVFVSHGITIYKNASPTKLNH